MQKPVNQFLVNIQSTGKSHLETGAYMYLTTHVRICYHKDKSPDGKGVIITSYEFGPMNGQAVYTSMDIDEIIEFINDYNF